MWLSKKSFLHRRKDFEVEPCLACLRTSEEAVWLRQTKQRKEWYEMTLGGRSHRILKAVVRTLAIPVCEVRNHWRTLSGSLM